MNAWVPNTVTLPNLGPIGASQTAVPVSKKFPITAGGSKNIVICISVSAVTGTIDATLRTSLGTATAVNAKAITISSTGNSYIKLNSDVAGDQTHLPLLSLGEIIVDTGAGEAITITSVQVLQED